MLKTRPFYDFTPDFTHGFHTPFVELNEPGGRAPREGVGWGGPAGGGGGPRGRGWGPAGGGPRGRGWGVGREYTAESPH